MTIRSRHRHHRRFESFNFGMDSFFAVAEQFSPQAVRKCLVALVEDDGFWETLKTAMKRRKEWDAVKVALDKKMERFRKATLK
jgi:hypothetical protein